MHEQDTTPLPFNVKGYSVAELKDIQCQISRYLVEVEEAERRGVWNSIVQSVRHYMENYGAIDVWDEDQECHRLDTSSFGGDAGTIRVFSTMWDEEED